MAFGFSQVTYVSNKTKCLLKIAEAKGSFDAVSIIEQIPIRSLRLKPLRFLMRERRDAAATRGTFLLGEGFGHVRGLRESGSTMLSDVRSCPPRCDGLGGTFEERRAMPTTRRRRRHFNVWY